MTVIAYVGVGSNLSHPARQVEDALDQLTELEDAEMLSRSSLYRSSPLGGIEQPDFINAVAGVATTRDARGLLLQLQSVEAARGRERDGQRWGPRILDLDLLVFGDERISEEGLEVPHPGIADRNFVLLPLREIAPDLVVPGLGPVAEIDVNTSEPRIELIV